MKQDAAAPAATTPTSVPATMRAWRQHRYGGPEVLEFEELPVPAAGKGQVLIKVRATALNAADVVLLRGTPMLVRPFLGLLRPRIAGRGMDVAGTVVAVGPGVEGFRVGDEVVGELPGGGLAEYVAGPAARLVRRPEELDAVTAAALPLAGGTAAQALGMIGDVAGRRVLVIGASGGVGTYCVELATSRGAEVWGLCGDRNEELVAGLGAVRTFDYRKVEAAALDPSSFDAIIDIAGTTPLRALRRLLRPGGTVVLVSGHGGPVLGPIGRLARAALLSLVPGPRLRPLAATAKPAITQELLELTVEGRLRPQIERTWPLAEASEALAHVDAGHTVGKVIVTLD